MVRLSTMQCETNEYSELVEYLTFVTSLPWSTLAPEARMSLQHARDIMRAQHYAMDEVRIINNGTYFVLIFQLTYTQPTSTLH